LTTEQELTTNLNQLKTDLSEATGSLQKGLQLDMLLVIAESNQLKKGFQHLMQSGSLM